MAKDFIYKDKKDELDKILDELQSPGMDIEEAIEKYKLGDELIKEIEDYLNKTKNRISKIKENKD